MDFRVKIASSWSNSISAIAMKIGSSWQSMQSAYINISGAWNLFFSAVSVPPQTSAPSIPGGTGKAFTSITRGTAGSYTSFSSKTHSLVKALATDTVSDASTTDTVSTVLTSTYTVTQLDASTPSYVFYTRDAVVGLNGTTYYFYSTPLSAYIGDITDNFNRTTSGGLGTSSSGYIYSSYSNSTGSWSTNGARAVNSTAVSSGAVASSHPLQTIETGGPNKNYSIDLPDGKGGQGVAFWTTSANSWYAVTSYYDYDSTTTTQVSCTGTETCTGLNCCSGVTFGSLTGQRCSSCPAATITYPCGQNGVTYTCSGFNCCTNNLGSLAGDYCNCTNSNTSSTTQLLTCSGSSSGSSCPSTGSTVGARCGSCTSTTTCTGSGSNSGRTCPDTGPNVGDRCGACTETSSTVNTLTGYTYSIRQSSSSTVDTFGLCRNFDPVAPSCPGGTLSIVSTGCSGSATRWRCRTTTVSNTCTGSATTVGCPDTGPNSGDRCGACNPNYSSVTTYTQSYSIRQQAYTYPVYAYEDVTTYTSNYQVRGTQYSYTYNINELATVSAYSYNSKIKLFSAISGTVAVQSWDAPYSSGQVASNLVAGSFDNTRWTGIYNITASTSGNTVTATAYDSGGGVIGQTVGKTVSSPTKQNANGETSAGVVKAYSPNNVGTLYDNLSIY